MTLFTSQKGGTDYVSGIQMVDPTHGEYLLAQRYDGYRRLSMDG